VRSLRLLLAAGYWPEPEPLEPEPEEPEPLEPEDPDEPLEPELEDPLEPDEPLELDPPPDPADELSPWLPPEAEALGPALADEPEPDEPLPDEPDPDEPEPDEPEPDEPELDERELVAPCEPEPEPDEPLSLEPWLPLEPDPLEDPEELDGPLPAVPLAPLDPDDAGEESPCAPPDVAAGAALAADTDPPPAPELPLDAVPLEPWSVLAAEVPPFEAPWAWPPPPEYVESWLDAWTPSPDALEVPPLDSLVDPLRSIDAALMRVDELPLLPPFSVEPGAWPWKPGVTLWKPGWSGGSLLLLAPWALPPPLLALIRAAIRIACLSAFFDMCMLSNGTCTTTKPGRGAPLNQPAPPPGFADDVPK
jgi:hypothetical protein